MNKLNVNEQHEIRRDVTSLKIEVHGLKIWMRIVAGLAFADLAVHLGSAVNLVSVAKALVP